MGERRGGEWVRTLSDMEKAIDGCLVVLEKYEAKFEKLLRPESAVSSEDETSIHSRELPKVEDAFADRVEAARAIAEEVERLLVEQEAVWSRWKDAYESWRDQLSRAPQTGQSKAA